MRRAYGIAVSSTYSPSPVDPEILKCLQQWHVLARVKSWVRASETASTSSASKLCVWLSGCKLGRSAPLFDL